MSGAAALPLPFADGAVHTATFVAAYALWVGSEMVLMRTRRATGSAVLERSSLRWLGLLLAAGVGSDFAVAALLPGASLGFAVPRVFWVGIVLIGAGLLLRWYAIAVLGRFSPSMSPSTPTTPSSGPAPTATSAIRPIAACC